MNFHARRQCWTHFFIFPSLVAPNCALRAPPPPPPHAHVFERFANDPFFSPLLYCHEQFDHITRSDASILPPKYKYEHEHVRWIHCSKWPRWKEQVSFDGRRRMESVTSGIEYSKTAVIRLFVYSMYCQWQQGTRFADPPCPFYPSVRQPTINSILHSEPKKKQSPYSSQPS